ncbi:hypothetical protein TNIN_329541 [Trichonephila inaurata madagascariensis]|uniref:Uncharacterized protein n=1 Tax=Trichonephila inaurata madagascariensis TaxID=2747483 RepID=A0A8X6YC00_9ARAC|nr:hypothetical protein TNIN_329541 [Trichonephila inaurata madagascariensis]
MNQEHYSVTREKSFVEGLAKVPEIYLPAIQELMCQLEVDPKTAPKKSRSGVHNGFITRIGDWRVFYIIDWKNKIVKLLNVGPRKNVYK